MQSISIDEVSDILLKVLNDDLSREAASDWAHELMVANDSGSLAYLPPTDEKVIWEAIKQILGIDLKDSPDSYLHDRENMIDWLSKLRK